MSNRLIEIGRIPLIPDPAAAVKAGALFAECQGRTDRVVQYKNDFFEPPTKLWAALRRWGQALDQANYMQGLSVMGDRALAIQGVQRDKIYELFFQKNADDFVDIPTIGPAGDNGR